MVHHFLSLPQGNYAPMFLVPSCAILLWMSRRSCSVTQNSMRIGLVRSAIGYSPPSNYNGQIFTDWGGDTRKNIPSHISTDSFEQKLGTCSEKFPFTLQRTFFSPISGYGRNKIFHAIKQSLSIYNGQFLREKQGSA